MFINFAKLIFILKLSLGFVVFMANVTGCLFFFFIEEDIVSSG
jgi:hypothetical protein